MDAARQTLAYYWPETRNVEWRIWNQTPDDYLPGDRFPLPCWSSAYNSQSAGVPARWLAKQENIPELLTDVSIALVVGGHWPENDEWVKAYVREHELDLAVARELRGRTVEWFVAARDVVREHVKERIDALIQPCVKVSDSDA